MAFQDTMLFQCGCSDDQNLTRHVSEERKSQIRCSFLSFLKFYHHWTKKTSERRIQVTNQLEILSSPSCVADRWEKLEW